MAGNAPVYLEGCMHTLAGLVLPADHVIVRYKLVDQSTTALNSLGQQAVNAGPYRAVKSTFALARALLVGSFWDILGGRAIRRLQGCQVFSFLWEGDPKSIHPR